MAWVEFPKHRRARTSIPGTIRINKYGHMYFSRDIVDALPDNRYAISINLATNQIAFTPEANPDKSYKINPGNNGSQVNALSKAFGDAWQPGLYKAQVEGNRYVIDLNHPLT